MKKTKAIDLMIVPTFIYLHAMFSDTAELNSENDKIFHRKAKC